MIPFARTPDGAYSVAFEREEASLISDLAGQIAELLDPLTSGPGDEDPLNALEMDDALETLNALETHGSLGLHTDPAIARLLPDAYQGDGDAASDFRRYTEQGLADRKVANALVVVETLAPVVDDPLPDDGEPGTGAPGADEPDDDSPVPLTLDEAQAQSWLRTLIDIRLTLAARLGIEHDEEEFDLTEADETNALLHDIYFWLGDVTASLLYAIDR